MNKMKLISQIHKGIKGLVVVLPLVALLGCDGFFGTKTDLSFLPPTSLDPRPVNYAPIRPIIAPAGNPDWNPIHIAAGMDDLLYAVDSAKGIYCFDESGRELGFLPIRGARFVCQDRKLDLLVVAKDTATIITGQPAQLTSIIYRINIRQATSDRTFGLGFGAFTANSAQDSANIRSQRIKRLVFPLFLGQTGRNTTLDNININAIAPLGDNDYYITVSSPVQSSPNESFGNNAVYVCFDPNNENSIRGWTPVEVVGGTGVSFNFFNLPFGITSLATPPNRFNLLGANSRDFIFTSKDPRERIKVRYVEYVSGGDIPFFRNKDLPTTIDTSVSDGVLYQLNRFIAPTDVTVAGDQNRFIFVIDKDSLYQFTIGGLEGVNEPPPSRRTKLVKVSFGGTVCTTNKEGQTSCNQLLVKPKSVAYMGRLVYVADPGQKGILRFRLSSDFLQ